MKCKNPFYLEKEKIVVPCGKCQQCLIRRKREWSYRLSCEMSYHKSSLFLTLTYDDEHLPYSCSRVPSLLPSDLQKFFKRIRKKGKKIKYYACGEYGDEYKRPHYHIILFGDLTYQDLLDMQVKDDKGRLLTRPNPQKNGSVNLNLSVWRYGIVNVGKVTFSSIGYVTSYIFNATYKKEYIKNFIYPPFNVMSKGLGKSYVFENYKIFKDGFAHMNGKKIPIPRYFKKVHFGLEADNYKQFIEYKPYSFEWCLALVRKIGKMENDLYLSFYKDIDYDRVYRILDDGYRERELTEIALTQKNDLTKK